MNAEITFHLFLVVISTGLVKGTCPSTCSCSSDSSGSNVNCYSKNLGYIPDLPSDTFYIDLRYNSITEIDVQFCKEMPKLKTLLISNNQISEIPVNTFVDCELLQTIYLHNNKISAIEPFTFMNLHNLRYLYLYNNEISAIESFAFMNLPNLQYLYLHHNKIRSLESNTFINMTNLYELQLQYNDISTIESFSFMNLPSLRYLNLSGNNISHIEENAFGNLTSLSTLQLASNPLNCDCSIYPFWSWLIERAAIGTSAKCSDGKFVISLRSAALEQCNPDTCHCFNGGKCVTMANGLAVCDCIGEWTGELCQESQCISHDCGFGNCYIEPMNGTAQCVCDDTYINYCPERDLDMTSSN
ncbi:PXDN [Mytilus coruscus]|uniref:PXDN n=1 Tax=Mytilus coruscus TaxID=42192 RepID=A0A6J8BXK2_MYTCO|nr:PXDN [Mytilus coruscus]